MGLFKFTNSEAGGKLDMSSGTRFSLDILTVSRATALGTSIDVFGMKVVDEVSKDSNTLHRKDFLKVLNCGERLSSWRVVHCVEKVE